MIWTEQYLTQLANDAIQRMNIDMPVIFEKQYLLINTGQSVYTLPPVVRRLERITWLGKKLEPVSWEELTALSPMTVGGFIETSISRPQWYALHPTNPYDIRLYPTPDLTFDAASFAGLNPYAQLDNEQACCISYKRDIDLTGLILTAQLPTYIQRRTQKSYVLWKAFSQEGKGQNKNAAKFYEMKYQFLTSNFMKINAQCFLASRYSLGNGDTEIDNFRYPRPTLPTQFERVIY
jgi:hypothetical protein